MMQESKMLTQFPTHDMTAISSLMTLFLPDWCELVVHIEILVVLAHNLDFRLSDCPSSLFSLGGGVGGTECLI
jgi:hypothetical protein